MKNHAFLLMVHKQPNLMGRIIRVLAKENHHFFIHVDKKVKRMDEFVDAVKNVHNVHFAKKRVSVYHCGISQLYALMGLFDEALHEEPQMDFFHVISGQDYPVRSNEQFDAFFEKTDHSFMYINSEELQLGTINNLRLSEDWHLNRTSGRFYKWFYKLHMPHILGVLFPRKQIPDYWGAWDWFSWSRRVLVFVMDYLNDNPKYVKRFNHTVCPTENIFSTLLKRHCEELGIEHKNPLRYISWHPHRPIVTTYRPFNFTEEDYMYIIDSKAFFCRKVDENESSKLLDMIDNQRGAFYDIDKHSLYT